MTSSLPHLIPTAVIGSYPQPTWLVDLAKLKEHLVPRVRADDIWRVEPGLLGQAQDDATVLAIRDMERAGIDIITDGEIRRESYSNRFIMGLDGIDTDSPVRVEAMPGKYVDIPRVIGPIRRMRPIEVEDMAFLRANTSRVAKITLPGPYTLSQQAKNEFYADDEEMAMAFAAAVNEEALALQAAGADVVQIDEPWLRRDPAAAARYAIKAVDRAFEGVTVTRALHLCFGYAFIDAGAKPKVYSFLDPLAGSVVDQVSVEAAQPGLDLNSLRGLAGKTVMLGVLDLRADRLETAAEVADRIRAGLSVIPPDRLIAAPDCGMKYLPRDLAYAKLKALSEGAAIVRAELTGH